MNLFEECKQKGFKPVEIKLDGSDNLENYTCAALVFGDGEEDYTVGKSSQITKDYCELHDIKLYCAASNNRLMLFARQNNKTTDFYCVEGIATTTESIYSLYFCNVLLSKGNDADFKLYGLIPITETE